MKDPVQPVAKPPVSLKLAMMQAVFGGLSRVAPGLASRVAVNLFRKPRRFTRPARELEILADATAFEVEVDSAARVKAWRWGSGPVVLLVHGWEGRGTQLAAFVRPLVAKGFTVVTFDAGAHGDSTGSRSSLPQFAAAVRAVSDATPAPAAIVAHSLGCAAVTLALRDGLTAQKFVFFSPPLDPEDYIARFGDTLNFSPEVQRRMKLRIERRFGRKWSDYALAGTASRMKAPLLVVHDRDDTETYWSEGSAVAAAWPGGRLLTTEGLGHRRILRDPAVVEEVVGFLAAQ